MASSAEIVTLDRLGEALLALGHDGVNLSAARDRAGRPYFCLDGRDADGRFFSGIGDTPGRALEASRREKAIRASGGIYVDA